MFYQNRDFLNNILNHLPILICYLDTDFRYKYINAKYAHWFNIDAKLVINKHLSEVVGENLFLKFKPIMESGLQGKIQKFDLNLSCMEDGNSILKDVQVTTYSDFNSDHQVIGYLTIIDTNITQNALIKAHSSRILLVEYCPTNQNVSLVMLQLLGLKADVVTNGLEAIDVLQFREYDLVLMDIVMHEMDGFEATKIIRNPASLVKNHSIPIIALTSNTSEADMLKCFELGMNGFVNKPINLEALDRALSKWLLLSNAPIKKSFE